MIDVSGGATSGRIGGTDAFSITVGVVDAGGRGGCCSVEGQQKMRVIHVQIDPNKSQTIHLMHRPNQHPSSFDCSGAAT
jgi:hypothetical protein